MKNHVPAINSLHNVLSDIVNLILFPSRIGAIEAFHVVYLPAWSMYNLPLANGRGALEKSRDIIAQH